MSDNQTPPFEISVDGRRKPLKFLGPDQILMIDEALSSLNEFGEIRLVVEKNRLRFVITQNSYDALKWHPGSLSPKRI
jgi:hypothetical protein